MRDATAIPARERFPETAKQKAQARKAKQARKQCARAGRRKGSRGGFQKAKAAARGTRIQRQRHQKLERMMQELPRQCDIGFKTSSQGHREYWRGLLTSTRRSRPKKLPSAESVSRLAHAAIELSAGGALPHLMFGVLALTVDQSLRMAAPVS